MRESLAQLMTLMQDLASEGRSVLGELMGAGTQPLAYAHHPADDAHDAHSGYRWYYHSHAASGRTPGEHGHFHLFRDDRDGDRVTHLVAIAVDARGWPLALVAPNAWVTDEAWAPASAVLRWIAEFEVLEPPALHRVHAWLALMLRAFAPQLRDLLLARDARILALRRSSRSVVLEDRRVAVLARCKIDLLDQAARFDRRDIHFAELRGARP